MPQYPRPYVGQPYRMTHNPERYVEGQVSGVQVSGVYTDPATGERLEDWTAVISSGIEGDGRVYARREMVEGGWLPVPAEECEKRYGVGYARLRDEIRELREKIDSLTSEVDERLEIINDNINDVIKSTVNLVTTPVVTAPVVTEATADVTTDAPVRRRRAG